MLNQFSRTELIVGKEAIEILNNAHIAVFGQIIATRSSVGKYKVDVMKERILDIREQSTSVRSAGIFLEAMHLFLLSPV